MLKCALGAAVVASLLGFAQARADEVSTETAAGASESHFHLLSTKCEVENESGPESTPQAPPLEVDDPGTPGCNRWEINVTLEGEFTRAENNYQLPHLDVNYGVGDNIQLKYEAPYMVSSGPGGTQNALGESTAGVKVQFYENEGIEYGVYPQLTFVQANASIVQQGLATPGAIVTLPVLMAKTVGKNAFGDIRMTANLGYNISSKADTKDFVSALIGIGSPISNKAAVMAEFSTEQAVSKLDGTRDQLFKTDVGVMATISKSLLVFGAVGHSLYASDSLQHTYALTGLRIYAGGPSASEAKTVASAN
jgi:hypothetical protein